MCNLYGRNKTCSCNPGRDYLLQLFHVQEILQSYHTSWLFRSQRVNRVSWILGTFCEEQGHYSSSSSCRGWICRMVPLCAVYAVLFITAQWKKQGINTTEKKLSHLFYTCMSNNKWLHAAAVFPVCVPEKLILLFVYLGLLHLKQNNN